jgi:Immunity protein 27
MTDAEIEAILSRFQKIGHDWSGWDTLYRDPASGELWEIIYPKSEMHGGGPRQLKAISLADARSKYGISN